MKAPRTFSRRSGLVPLALGLAAATAPRPASADTCIGEPLLQSLGRDTLLVGVKTSEPTAQAAAAGAPFDISYKYIADTIFDGAAPCASCASGCTAEGVSCANGQCAWWGCWQWDQLPPGDYVRRLIQENQQVDRIPMITYDVFRHLTGVSKEHEEDEVLFAAQPALMARYLADFRFMLQQIGQATALVHVEPDLWGYAQRWDPDPHAQFAAVASANPTDCAGEEDSIAGMGRCMVAMARKYAPNAKIGLHGSAWATGIDVYMNTDPGFDVASEAALVGAYLDECAPTADFIVVETSDRDAEYYATKKGEDRWWDATNATLPNFHQAFDWARSVAEEANKPLVWWQIPVGNMGLSGTSLHWKDNRVDYFFDHTDEVIATHAVAMAFGEGWGCQTRVDTDGGNLVSRVIDYAASGAELACQLPCPLAGSHYDGASCWVATVPAGTTPFIWQGTMLYHTPVNGSSCPLPGSHYDGSNCWVATVPAGTTPFIWQGTMLYHTPVNGSSCPLPGSHYDGSNCWVATVPAGTTPFIWQGTMLYHTPVNGSSCPLPGSHYDGSNCWVATVPAGTTPFIWQGTMLYHTPVSY
ncbi:hypothetical protein BE04_15295 [Sorangium cellulosum]|uniref:Uncharacterized protein n=1 Tax=Sorangium cellulosum TaxID=56 RepID=A0A150NYC0_SORCE|nr:hypothetical protein BE04_15295 [Sorangium cellulosum]